MGVPTTYRDPGSTAPATPLGALAIQGGKIGTNPGGVRTWNPGYAGQVDVAAGVNVSDGLSYTYSIALDFATGQQTVEVKNASGVSQGSYTGGFIFSRAPAQVTQVTFSLPGRLNWMDARLDNLKLEVTPEPGSALLLLLGFAGAALRRGRRD